ncbi:hypothetical protein HYDPIDRAFT_87040 [Hydnomerulius pinastri MD-312]|nr:hypothetical protein HYDPIDRAFT_87040 [Hydnomerulius pinastri MD-312]
MEDTSNTDTKKPLVEGNCFCKQVSFAIYGTPIIRVYCHCTLCQKLAGCPMIHSIHVNEADFAWTSEQPAESLLDAYENPLRPHARRFRCKNCGTAVAAYHNQRKRYAIWGANLARDTDDNILNWEFVKPTAHIFYDTRMLDINDDLSKWEGYEGNSKRLG